MCAIRCTALQERLRSATSDRFLAIAPRRSTAMEARHKTGISIRLSMPKRQRWGVMVVLTRLKGHQMYQPHPIRGKAICLSVKGLYSLGLVSGWIQRYNLAPISHTPNHHRTSIKINNPSGRIGSPCMILHLEKGNTNPPSPGGS